ncbi:MAG TPA: hypothetical protein VKF37_14845 [Chloroflexota bacterium]|nr:hypothetical protein [Chloroflexota bacterium]
MHREPPPRRVARQWPVQSPQLSAELLGQDEISGVIGAGTPKAEGGLNDLRAGCQGMQLERDSLRERPRSR